MKYDWGLKEGGCWEGGLETEGGGFQNKLR